jgi:hypothetical protein
MLLSCNHSLFTMSMEQACFERLRLEGAATAARMEHRQEIEDLQHKSEKQLNEQVHLHQCVYEQ